MQPGNKRQDGFTILIILMLTLGIMAGALVMLAERTQRLQDAQFDQLIETIHRARIWSLHHYKEHQAWPSVSALIAGTELASYVQHVDVVLDPQPRLQIQLATMELQERVQPFILASWLEGSWLAVALPNQSAATDLDHAQYLHRYEPEPGVSPSMRTHLSMQLHDLIRVGSLSVRGLASLEEVWAQQSEVGLAGVTEVSSTSVSSAATKAQEMRAAHFSVQTLQAQTVSLDSVAVETMSITGEWQPRKVRAEQSDFVTGMAHAAEIVNVTAAQAMMEELQVTAARAQSSEMNHLEGTMVWVNQLKTTQVSAAAGNFGDIQSIQGSVGSVSVDSIDAAGQVYLEQGIASVIDNLQVNASSLYADLYACWYEHQWCRAAEPPIVSGWHCTGCTQASLAGSFSASIRIETDVCIHGCFVTSPSASGIQFACDADAIAAQSAGNVQCSIQAELAAGDLRQGQVPIRMHSGKDTGVFTDVSIPYSWRAFMICPATLYAFPVVQSSPVMDGYVIFPERTSGEIVQVQEFGGACNSNVRSSGWVCTAQAQCGAQGVWENIQGNCWCDLLQ